MKKKVITLIAVLSVLLLMTGCAELVSKETEQVEVLIVDEHHRGLWMQPIRAGKVTTFITHPAVYDITVKYNNVEYIVSGRDVYEKYKDCIGQTATATLVIKTYDNGKISIDITELK